MTLDELRQKGYRFRIGFGSWTVFRGDAWLSVRVASGKLTKVFVSENPGRTARIEDTNNKKAIEAAIGAACADLVKRRVNGQKI